MHLVVNQVIELQHVHDAHCYRAIELISRTAIEQQGLAVLRQTCELKHFLNLDLISAIEHAGGHWHPCSQVIR